MKGGSMMKRLNITLAIINILLVVAMVLHVGIMMYIHSQNTDWGSPAYIELVKAVFYIVPLMIVNVVGLIIRLVLRKKSKNSSERRS